MTLGPLRMEVVGHEFPDADPKEDWHDANWLVIRIALDGAGPELAFDDPCLTTLELVRFTDACQEMARGDRTRARLEPIEPTLEIDLTATGDDIAAVIEVLRHGARDTGLWNRRECRLPRAALTAFVQAARQALASNPVRRADA